MNDEFDIQLNVIIIYFNRLSALKNICIRSNTTKGLHYGKRIVKTNEIRESMHSDLITD